MKKIISIVTACVLAAGASYAAMEKPVAKQAPAASKSEAPVVAAAADTGVYDYRLERESCCGPQN